MSITLSGLQLTYSVGPRSRRTSIVALDGVDLAVTEGELLVVVGPSGSGKTSLLRCVAGLEAPDAGRVHVKGRDVTAEPPGRRDVAMVFQEYALYPHLTVEANIAFGLKARKVPTNEISARIQRVAQMLELNGVLGRHPTDLSGGERQRVALARAVSREPAAFLMDEPLSNLDAELRAHTRGEIRALQKRLGTTTLYVTHDQIEAMTMGTRVAVLRAGRVEQVGPPLHLYERPANAFVARFLGTPPMNLFPVELLGGERRALTAGLRPERVRLTDAGAGKLGGRVVLVEPTGAEGIAHVDVEGERVLARMAAEVLPREGDSVGLSFDDSDLYFFDGADGRAVP